MRTIKTDKGYVSGTVIGEPGNEISIFRGIPYAASTAGEFRWKPPQPVAAWNGIRECTAFSAISPQGSIVFPPNKEQAQRPDPPPAPVMPQSEDCLYLNVLTPAMTEQGNLPVMVWIHGGGFVMGSGNEALCNFYRLPQHGVVLVNVNTRLGPLGLLANRLLSRESGHGVSGNYMFLDLVAALQWVQKNIAAFGGNPDNVTIFGESGGGAKVVSLMASPLARGLFHRAIAESGSPDGKSLDELESRGDLFFERLGVDKAADPVRAARELPWQRILEVEREIVIEKHIMGRGGFWDVAVDNWFLKDTPLNVFSAGGQQPVPYILLANLGELQTMAGSYIHSHYMKLLSGAEKTGKKAFPIIFDKVPDTWRNEGCVSFHALELGYVFGDWDDSTGFWTGIRMMAGPAGAKSDAPGLSDTDRKISGAMMQMWTQFARTGNPGVKGLVDWPAWDGVGDRYLYVNESLEVKSGYSNISL